MVDAQQARRVLDRLVGYKISPLLWDKVRRGLSAGRVQSVALKLVCDREAEIDRFVSEEYWNIGARLAGPQPPEFDAKLLKRDGANVKISNKEEADAALADLRRSAVDRQRGHHQGAQEGRGAALHHQQAAAGVTVPGQEDDDDRSAALRRHRAARRCRHGRSHYLHANRLDARVGAGAHRGPRVHRREVRARLRAGEAQPLPRQEGRAGRPRGHPADLSDRGLSSGQGPRAPDAGSGTTCIA